MAWVSDHFIAGSYDAICDQCGGVFRADKLLLQGDGARVCESCWDPRHPQEHVRPTHERAGVPWSQPPPAIVFEELYSGRVLDSYDMDSISLG